MERFIAVLLFFLAACGSGQYLNEADVELAQDESCLHDVNPDPEQACEEGLEELDELGIEICEWDFDFTTSFQTYVCFQDGFFEGEDRRDFVRRSRTIHHELVHYCQRGMFENFEYDWTKNLRFKVSVELQGFRESVRSMVTHREPCSRVRPYIDRRPQVFRDRYKVFFENLDEVTIDTLNLETDCP